MTTSPAARLAFAMLAFVQCSLIFTIALIMVPLPKIAAEFGLTATDVLTLQIAYGLPFSGLLLFGGRLADRYGGRRMFIFGLILFGGASVVAAMAPTYELLAAMRFLEGVAGATIAPAAMSLLHRLFPNPKDFGQAMATWGGVSVLGAILGFVVSGIVTTWVSWRWMFAVPILVASVALISTSVLLPRDGDENLTARPRLDPLGALLATAGIVLGSYGLIMTGDHPWASKPVLVPVIASAILLAVFFAVEGKMRDPMLPPAFLADPCRITGLLGMMLAAVGSIAIEYILSLYLQQVRGWSPLTTTLAFLPFAVMLIVTNHLSPALVGRFGAVQITISGLVVAAFGLGLLAGLASDSSYLVGLMPGTLLVAVGMSLMFSGSTVLSMTNVPLRQAGLAGGVMNTAMELGPTVGLAVLMSVAATQGDVVRGYGWAFGAACLFHIILAVFAARSGRQGACAVVGG